MGAILLLSNPKTMSEEILLEGEDDAAAAPAPATDGGEGDAAPAMDAPAEEAASEEAAPEAPAM